MEAETGTKLFPEDMERIIKANLDLPDGMALKLIFAREMPARVRK